MRTDPCHIERVDEKWEQRARVCILLRVRVCIVSCEPNLYTPEREDIIECELASCEERLEEKYVYYKKSIKTN